MIFTRLVLWLTFFLALPVLAQQGPLTWEQCAHEASEQNPDILIAQANVEGLRAQVRVAWSGFYPQLSTQVSATQTNNSATGTAMIGPSSTLTSDREIRSATWSFNLTQNLFNGGQDAAKVAQAKSNLLAAQASLDMARAKLSKELKTAFAQLLFAQRQVDLLKEIVSRREFNSRLVTSLYKSGRENEGSFLQAQSLLEQSRLDLMQAENAFVVASENLSTLLGRSPDATLRVADDLKTRDIQDVSDFDELIFKHPSWLQSSAQYDAAKAAARLAHGFFFPTLDGSASFSNKDNYLFQHDNRWSVGLTLAFPLFSGFKYSAGAQVAEAQQRASQYTLSSLRLQLRVQLRQAHFAWREAIQKEAVDQAFERAVKVREKIATKKYNLGLMTFENWDLIESDLITRQKAALQSHRDRITSEAAWEQAQGKADLP